MVSAALDAAAAAGPFFVLDVDSPPVDAGGEAPAWRPFEVLIESGEALRGRIAAVRTAVATRAAIEVDLIDPRAAASLTHLGLVARLVCPPLGAALLGGVLVELDARTLWWRDVLGPVPLAAPDLRGRAIDRTDPAALATALAAGLSGGPVARLTAAVAGTGVSRRVLWGNVASAVAGALPALLRAAPAHAAVVAASIIALLDAQPLAGAGTWNPAPGGTEKFRGNGFAFRRNSCCLYYRVPGGGYCGDCVLG
jgi:hypothetical protein